MIVLGPTPYTTAAGFRLGSSDPVQPPVVPVTAGMTGGIVWSERGAHYIDLANVVRASLRLTAGFGPSDQGVLMEAGATGKGVILYVHAGRLYVQAGEGTATGTSRGRAEVSWPIPAPGSYVIEWSADSTSSLVLYVDGQQVGRQEFSADIVSGSNVGTIGAVAMAAPINRGGWTTDGAGFFTGDLSDVTVFPHQKTSDV